jgi:general secretion pathway protein M
VTGRLKDKRLVAVLLGLALFIVLIAFGLNMLSSERKELQSLKGQLMEMITLKDEFMRLKQQVDSVEMKKNLVGAQGIVQAIDNVFQPLGLKEKVKSVKPGGKREIREGFEEEADVVLEKVTMNEMANIFYRIEHAPMILTVKKAAIKKSFENPELLNITLVLSFLKTK